ncbi:Zinc/iron permease [Lipomyces arxii]|uniref:Zinc/iron permease n=1 Tax=Lipomyces arxii TaxID=56418 RepID=UPI0034CDC1E2
MPLHIGAVAIVFGVSSCACAFPLLALHVPWLHIPPRFLFTVRHFGTGVLLATAFVHLFPTAFLFLTDPCLPSFWHTEYPAMAGAIALAAVFLISVVEMVFCHGGSACNLNEMSDLVSVRSDRSRASVRSGFQLQRMVSNNEEIIADLTAPRNRMSEKRRVDVVEESDDGEGTQQRAMMQCLFLELGILFHSVFIGMALSVEVGSDFIVLFIAIAFHQTFEGMALGSRIAALNWPNKSVKPWLMALAYGCTTPIGQAIGLATHTFYDPDSQTGLLLVGIMNSVSAGLLTFTSLVDLLAQDFLSEESWSVLRGMRRYFACTLVFMGAFCMSLVGAWA